MWTGPQSFPSVRPLRDAPPVRASSPPSQPPLSRPSARHQEALESCQTRVSKLELQQQQQQTVQLENHDARVLLGKSINIMLAIVTVLLVCVSTAAKFAAPLMRSRHHLVATVLGVCFLAVFWRNWDRLQCALERMLVPA